MAGPTTFRKRERERALQQRQQDKAQKRKETKEKKAEKASTPGVEGAEDPDIAGIIPGPQPQPDFEAT